MNERSRPGAMTGGGDCIMFGSGGGIVTLVSSRRNVADSQKNDGNSNDEWISRWNVVGILEDQKGTGEVTGIMAKVLVETAGPVTTIILNRPDKRNAVDAETAALLRAAFSAFDASDAAKVAVLCGEGGSFCAGYDLTSLSANGLADDPDDHGPMGPSRMLVGKPVIAAVEGYAVAGGLELALLCDLRVASETAVFGVFCRRWGVPLIDGGSVRLPRIIGHGRALDMILTGRPVDAREALTFGLVNRITDPGGARGAAEALAREIAAFPQTCMRGDRLSAHGQWALPLHEALRNEARIGAAALAAEAADGATRFAGGKGRGGTFSDF